MTPAADGSREKPTLSNTGDMSWVQLVDKWGKRAAMNIVLMHFARSAVLLAVGVCACAGALKFADTRPCHIECAPSDRAERIAYGDVLQTCSVVVERWWRVSYAAGLYSHPVYARSAMLNDIRECR